MSIRFWIWTTGGLIAAREHIDAWTLIEFNFQTQVPEEVNWYLKGTCRLPAHQRRAQLRLFRCRTSELATFTSPFYAPPTPRPIPWYDQLKKLKYEVEVSIDPQRERFLCMLNVMENRRDDRVIFWSDISPDDAWAAPLGVERASPFEKRFIDLQWLFNHIKTWQDVAALPLGNGVPRSDTFVVSFHKFLFGNRVAFHRRVARGGSRKHRQDARHVG